MGVLPVRVIHLGHEKGSFPCQYKTAVDAQAPYRVWTGRQPWRHLSLYNDEHRETEWHCTCQQLAYGDARNGEKQQSRLEVGNQKDLQHRCRHRPFCQSPYAHG